MIRERRAADATGRAVRQGRLGALGRPAVVMGVVALAALAIAVERSAPQDEALVAAAVHAALARDMEGRLALSPSPAFAALEARYPGLWFRACDGNGECLSYGPVPDTLGPPEAGGGKTGQPHVGGVTIAAGVARQTGLRGLGLATLRVMLEALTTVGGMGTGEHAKYRLYSYAHHPAGM